MPHVEHAAAMHPGPIPMVPKRNRSRIGIASEDDDRWPGREHRVAERMWEDSWQQEHEESPRSGGGEA